MLAWLMPWQLVSHWLLHGKRLTLCAGRQDARLSSLSGEVQRLQEELGSARAAALDCQEMLEELQAFSGRLQQQHDSLADQLQVRESPPPCSFEKFSSVSPVSMMRCTHLC